MSLQGKGISQGGLGKPPTTGPYSDPFVLPALYYLHILCSLLWKAHGSDISYILLNPRRYPYATPSYHLSHVCFLSEIYCSHRIVLLQLSLISFHLYLYVLGVTKFYQIYWSIVLFCWCCFLFVCYLFFFVCFVFPIAWTQADAVWEKGTSIEKMPPSDWIVGKTVRQFLKWMMDVNRPSLLLEVPPPGKWAWVV